MPEYTERSRIDRVATENAVKNPLVAHGQDERLTSQIADALMTHLNARGALVVIESEHFCMKIRGVNKPNSVMVTSAVRGHFKTHPSARAEAMAVVARKNGC